MLRLKHELFIERGKNCSDGTPEWRAIVMEDDEGRRSVSDIMAHETPTGLKRLFLNIAGDSWDFGMSNEEAFTKGFEAIGLKYTDLQTEEEKRQAARAEEIRKFLTPEELAHLKHAFKVLSAFGDTFRNEPDHDSELSEAGMEQAEQWLGELVQ